MAIDNELIGIAGLGVTLVPYLILLYERFRSGGLGSRRRILATIAKFDTDFGGFMSSLRPTNKKFIPSMLMLTAMMYIIQFQFLIGVISGNTGNFFTYIILYLLIVPMLFFVLFALTKEFSSNVIRNRGWDKKLDFTMTYTLSELIPWIFFVFEISLLGSFLSLSFYQVTLRTGLTIFFEISLIMLPYAVFYIVLWAILLFIGRNNLAQLYDSRFKGLPPKLNVKTNLGRGNQPMDVFGTVFSIGNHLMIKREEDGYLQMISWRSILTFAVSPRSKK